MRDLLAEERRRRLRLIQTTDEESEKNFHSAVSALSIASQTEETRHDLEFMRHQLIEECQPDTSARLRVELHGAAPAEVGLDRPFILIGSAADCDLQLDHLDVCPRHLLFIWIDGQLFCCDISPSTNLFPGQELGLTGWWVNQNPMDVGPFRLSLTDSVPQTVAYSPLDRSQRLSTEYPLLALQFDGVAQKDNIWPINRVLTLIGRNATCKLRLNHKSIAPVQACLLRTDVGCWLIDIAKNGSTFVNGRSVPFSSLDTGDELQFGEFFTEVGTIAVPVSSTNKVSSLPANSDRLPTIQQKFDVAETTRLAPLPLTMQAPPLATISVPASEPVLATVRFPSTQQEPPITIPVSVAVPSDRQQRTASESLEIDHERRAPEAVMQETIAEQIEFPLQAPIVSTEPIEQKNGPTLDFKFLAQLLEQQQLEMAQLKSRLFEFKRTYDAATGSILSKKLRDALEKPVVEILKSHTSLEKIFEELNQAIDQKPR